MDFTLLRFALFQGYFLKQRVSECETDFYMTMTHRKMDVKSQVNDAVHFFPLSVQHVSTSMFHSMFSPGTVQAFKSNFPTKGQALTKRKTRNLFGI